MGSNLVAADYRASYLMLSHVWSRHRVSIRWEDWRVAGQQDYWLRNTDSDGTAYALAWRYDLSDHWQIGVEYLRNSNAALSRLTMAEPAEAAQQHWLVVVQYRFYPMSTEGKCPGLTKLFRLLKDTLHTDH